MLKLDGKKVSEHIRTGLAERTKEFEKQSGMKPHLVVILIGDDKASEVYVKNKEIACEKIGMKSTLYKYSSSLSQQELENKIDELNRDHSVHGVLVQMPLPKHLNAEKALEKLSSDKDADGFTNAQMGLLFKAKPGVVACTPAGVMEILKFYNISVAGKTAVVIGRSQIVGKPMAQLLLNADATVTICHSRTLDLKKHTLAADIVVVAAGKAHMVDKSFFKKDAVVIDVGIHRLESGLTGDVNPVGLEDQVSAFTPVPGGVGPMTITMLLKNTLDLAESKL